MVSLSSEYGAYKGTQRRECKYPAMMHRCRANSSRMSQSRPDSGLGVQDNILKRFIFLSSFRSGPCTPVVPRRARIKSF